MYSVDRIICYLNNWGHCVCMTLKLCVFAYVVILYPPVHMLCKSNKLLKTYILKLTVVYMNDLVVYRMKRHWINFTPLWRKDTRTDMEILFKLPKFLIHQDRHSQIWLMLNWKITRYYLCLSFRLLKMENGLFTEMMRIILIMNCKRKVL